MTIQEAHTRRMLERIDRLITDPSCPTWAATAVHELLVEYHRLIGTVEAMRTRLLAAGSR